MVELAEQGIDEQDTTTAEDVEQPPVDEPGDSTDADADDEQQQPAEPPVSDTAPLTEKEMERVIAKLDTEAKRHAAAVSKIMGEDANDLDLCPLCWEHTPGFRLPVPPVGEQLDAVRAALGEQADENFEPAPDARVCDGCKGLGRVLTGSHVAVHLTKACAKCSGTGYVVVSGPSPENGSAPNESAPSPIIEAAPEPAPDADPWGRVPGDPDYGRLPQFVR